MPSATYANDMYAVTDSRPATKEIVMTVQELIDILAEMDPAAELVLATDRRDCIEFELEGVALREEAEDMSDDDDEGDDDEDGEAEPRDVDGDGALSDVILVLGEQLRYGPRVPRSVIRS